MNLFELFVKIGVDDQASGKISKITKKIGNGLGKASKIGATAVVTLGTVAAKTFADFEQLVGGTELMFGDAFETVMNNAKNAYKTVQMSQNEYLSQVNGFATGLKTALGGNEQAAADLAHRIVQAEADIVAATGNTQENVQNAFNGIMKSNFTMLDNLQIGITPTKEGFQEVIDKVNEWNEANGRATEYQMGNLADMQSALVDYIEMVGMSGYAQEEASGTILGSFASMKAAASDFMTAMVDDNADVGESFEILKETALTFFNNVEPKVWQFLSAISPISTVVAGTTAAFIAFKTAAAISGLLTTLTRSWKAYAIANQGATVAQWLLNAAMSANPIVLIVTLIAGLVAAMVTLWKTNEKLRNKLISAWNAVKGTASAIWNGIGDGFLGLVESAKTWGKDLIDNFIGGIKAKWDALKNTVGQTAQTIKDYLGFSEPEKGPLSNFHTYAPDMMDLFIKGIKDNEGRLRSQIADTFNFGDDIVSNGFDGSFGQSRSYAGGSVSVIQNIYSKAQTAADLMEEARYQQEKAVYLGV